MDGEFHQAGGANGVNFPTALIDSHRRGPTQHSPPAANNIPNLVGATTIGVR